MFDLKQPKHQLALGALVILIALKFLIVPLFDWQNSQLAQLANLQKRAVKSQNVIVNQSQINQAQQTINAQLKAVNSLFVDYQRESEFKLAMQQQIEQTIANNQLQINTSSWLPSITVASNQLIRHQLRLNLKGKMRDFINFITLLESKTPKAELKSLNINLKGQKSDGLGNMSGSLELAFYMHQAPSTGGAQ
ncbi:GspMb/PilO family protein [Pseudoalteromonas sp. APC 3224]|uniref:GspMb/PilO family protein n=1 Tax=Pseudoalteromonas sp. APC 3224 TaxID=3035203 RepID=UPI0025B343AB|nr:GspMb/PilO family protein [Pseudoalteromonas sp. APC 3224]MDN3484899.1 GspMb/PilO family protein [Pseudoalteromonas sp. APC 3224]